MKLPALPSLTSVKTLFKGALNMNPLALLNLSALQAYAIAFGVVAVVSFGTGWHVKSRLDEAQFVKLKLVASQEQQRQSKAAVDALDAARAREAISLDEAEKDKRIIDAYQITLSKSKNPACGITAADRKRLRQLAR